MNRVLLGLVCLNAGLICGCDPTGGARVVGSGNVITQTPTVDAFEAVHFVGAFTVDVAVGKPSSVAITTDDNIMPLITTTVEGGTLVVRLTEHVKPSQSNLVKITVPSLVRLAVEGAASAKITDIAGPSFEFSSSGAGEVTATGAVDELTFHVSGAGSIDALGLEAKAVKVSISGAGSVQTHAVDTLDISLSGIGSVKYKGDPKVTKSVSGLGTVSKVD